MQQHTHHLTIRTHGKGLVPCTQPILDWVAETGIETGLLTLWCPHTSCSLTVQENTDPDVLRDIVTFFDTLVPEQAGRYRHADEGPDDMPAHLRTMLTQSGLSIPVMDGEPVLGIWQAIYIFEHRRAPHERRVICHLLGD